ncbi:hypothetical protein P7K49_010758 [Saguinus oedipus]|uniref:Uncharacterized protein n=1 Tax=Saguinus oedipus TaxID=9490 RepID=A0ABQ9VP34_SAGOE|nr:hypothetical protein P7K49_010758 [Saguinus oedipus]
MGFLLFIRQTLVGFKTGCCSDLCFCCTSCNCGCPENHEGILMNETEKTGESQSDQQMHQAQPLPVHPQDSTKLSRKQLVLRRGLLLLGVFLILLVGILVRLYVRIQ